MTQSCFIAALVARASDKFPLCTFSEPSFLQHRGAAVAKSICTEQMERVLSRFKPSADNSIQSFDLQEFTYYVLPDAPHIVVLCVNRQASPFAVGASSASSIDQRIQQSSCRLLEEIESEFSNTYRPELVNSASKPYQFIRFDTHIQKLFRRATQSVAVARPSYAAASASGGTGLHNRRGGEPQQQQQQQPPVPLAAGGDQQGMPSSGQQQQKNPNDPYDMIRREVDEVRGVMRQNLDDLMTRGERLETMSLYSSQLNDSSKNYYQTTKNMNRMRLLKLYGPPVAIITLIFTYLWFFVF